MVPLVLPVPGTGVPESVPSPPPLAVVRVLIYTFQQSLQLPLSLTSLPPDADEIPVVCSRLGPRLGSRLLFCSSGRKHPTRSPSYDFPLSYRSSLLTSDDTGPGNPSGFLLDSPNSPLYLNLLFLDLVITGETGVFPQTSNESHKTLREPPKGVPSQHTRLNSSTTSNVITHRLQGNYRQ